VLERQQEARRLLAARFSSALSARVLAAVDASAARPTLARDVVRSFRAGRHAEAFATFLWEDHWTTPLAEVRAMLGVEPVTAAAWQRAGTTSSSAPAPRARMTTSDRSAAGNVAVVDDKYTIYPAA
jgi:hypothetical protein